MARSQRPMGDGKVLELGKMSQGQDAGRCQGYGAVGPGQPPGTSGRYPRVGWSLETPVPVPPLPPPPPPRDCAMLSPALSPRLLALGPAWNPVRLGPGDGDGLCTPSPSPRLAAHLPGPRTPP